MKALRRLLARGAAKAPEPAPLRLDQPVFVIGDVHGRDDLLADMLARIGTERVVLVGDMIDRGPDSAAVLRRMRAACAAAPGRVVCLMGNHERMLLAALEAPGRHAARWLGHGGAETLASLGLSARAARPAPATDWAAALPAAMRAALPDGMEDWLRGLPLIWQDGPLAVVHAAMDPARPPGAQTETALLWGHRDFGTRPRADGIWVAHGHVVVPEAFTGAGRIAVDTGAWATGRLTAARIGPEGVSFIEVRG